MTKVSCLLSLAAALITSPISFGQTPDHDAAETAVIREEKAIVLRNTLSSAKTAVARGDITVAAKLYTDAYNLSDELGNSVEKERGEAVAGVSSTRLALAIAAAKAGDYHEADLQIKQARKVDPSNTQVINFEKENDKRVENQAGKVPSEGARSYVSEYRTNQITAATLARDGKLMLDIGRLDDAEADFKAALKIDKDNEAAIYYMKIVTERKYSRLVRRHEVTTGQRILDVEEHWITPENNLPIANPNWRTNLIYTGKGRQAVKHKLETIVLDELKLPGIPLGEVVKLLKDESRKRDPDHDGLNFMVSLNVDNPPAQTQPTAIDPQTGLPVAPQQAEQQALSDVQIRIDPPLTKITMADALEAITLAADRPIKFSLVDYMVVFSQRLPEPVQLYTRTFRVDPDTFVQGLESVVGLPIGGLIQGGQGGGAGGGGAAGGAGGQGGGGLYSVPRVQVANDATGGGGGFGGGGGGAGGIGGGGIGIAGVTRTNNMAFVQILVRQFFLAAGVQFPVTAVPGLGGAGGLGGGLGGGGFGGGAFGGGAFGAGAGGLNDPFADQKALFYNDRTGVLFVRATLSDLDIIEKAIQALNQAPPQVQIEARFAEVNQTDTKALGFDWYLGNFIMGGMGLMGGTAPSIQGRPSAANPGSTVVDTGGNTISSLPGGVFPGTSAETLQSSQNTDQLVTSGLRTSGNGSTSVPALATLTGILTDPQFRAVIHALNQRDGVDLLSAPKVTTLSGRQAQIQVSDVRTIATGLGTGQNGQGGGGGAGTAGTTAGVVGQTFTPLASAYIPNTAVVPFGPTLDVIPYVASDDVSIKLTLIPTYTEFVGYDDPGPFVPQIVVATGGNIATRTAVLPLPRLRVRQVATSAIVWDGQTIALGGLIAEDSTKQQDKVPGLGDLPLIGRLFRSEFSQTSKKNLIIFVTPTIIDPAGKRVHDPNNLPFDPNSLPSPAGK